MTLTSNPLTLTEALEAEAVAELIQLLHCPCDTSRATACTKLATMGERAEMALLSLRHAQKDASPQVREAADTAYESIRISLPMFGPMLQCPEVIC